MTARPPAAPGMPGEEEIARALSVADGNHPDACSNDEDEQPLWQLYTEAARAILSLIRPAFEAKDAEIERLKKLPVIADYIEVQEARRALEAKLARAVEALPMTEKDFEAIADALADETQAGHHVTADDVAFIHRKLIDRARALATGQESP